MKRLILVCDASRARLLTAGLPDEPLTVDRTIYNARGRARNQALRSDEPGRVLKVSGGVMSAMDPRTMPHEVEIERFAAQLARQLEVQLSTGDYDSFILVAPPHLLGLLRGQLAPQQEIRMAGSLAVDLTHANEQELSQHLRHVLWPGC